MKSIKHYDGLYRDLNFKPPIDYIFFEMIETRSREFGWVIDPHLHTHLYQFFFVDYGTIEFTGSGDVQKLTAPCILIIPPNNLHGLTYSADVQGNILTVSNTVMEDICKTSPPVLVLFEKAHQLLFSGTNDPLFIKIKLLLTEIDDELFTNKPEKKPFLNTCFLKLFIYIIRIFNSNTLSGIDDTNTTLKHFKNFQSLIKKTDFNRNISALSKELRITGTHLNRICKQVSGRSALVFLQEYKIDQAKNYLAHTSMSVSEIAYHLHFEYPNYFAKLFRKITGLTPTEFRDKKSSMAR
jgi:AraC family transcriptional activator of pobA